MTTFRPVLLGCCAVLASVLAPRALAHDVPGTAVDLDLGPRRVLAEMQLPLSELAIAVPGFDAASAAQPGFADYIRSHLAVTTPDGVAYALAIGEARTVHCGEGDCLQVAVTLTPPAGADATDLVFDDRIITAELLSHQIFVFLRRDFAAGLDQAEPRLLGVLQFQHTQLRVSRSGATAWRGFAAFFRAGLAHIATGVDHLLFLLMLLLPAVLSRDRSGWGAPLPLRRCVAHAAWLVTAFTIGHSVALVFAALTGRTAPGRTVEVAIAVTVLVSAIHAWRPLLRGPEYWVALFFGLVHGLAFAEVLRGFGYDGRALGVALLGFNLGIESFQLMLVLLTLPVLYLLARHRAFTAVRTAVAAAGACVAIAWIVQRTGYWPRS